MIRITQESDIQQLLEQGLILLFINDYEDGDDFDCCNEFWYITDAINAPSGKSIYCYSFIYDPDCGGYWDKWYKDYQQWLKEDKDNFLSKGFPCLACTKEEVGHTM